MTRASEPSYELIDLEPRQASFRDDVIRGLRKSPKAIPPKYFYDVRGSELFDAITRLPEYYLTRSEIQILKERASEVAELVGPDATLIELGSGSSTKVRILLDELRGQVVYMPVDISREYLDVSASSVASDYPSVRVVALCADYSRDLLLPDSEIAGPRLVFFPGSTVGNTEPDETRELFRAIDRMLRPGDGLLIGFDLVKEKEILDHAYDDAAGVTAEFNLNLLRRINRELGGTFDVDSFEHVAGFDEKARRIEMHLRSVREQQARVADETFSFSEGECIHTENSYKYVADEFPLFFEGTRFRQRRLWFDDEHYFAVALFEIA